MRGEHGAKECRIAVDVLGGPELQGEDLRGGVVDGAEQHQLGAPVLKPGEGAAVDLDQRALGGLGHAPAAGAGRPAGALGRLPELPAHPAHRLTGEGEAVAFAEFLGQMRVIEAAVRRGQEADHRLPHGGGQPPGGGATATAVRQGRCAAALPAPLQSSHVADAHPEGDGHLPVRHPARAGRLEQPRTMQFLSAQREGLHGRRTLSRGS